MSPTPRILITDRNPNVRELLRREFAKHGVRADTARDGREVCARLCSPEPPHLLVLDPEIPHAGSMGEWARRRGGAGPVAVVLNTFTPDAPGPLAGLAVAVVEKDPDTDLLWERVRAILAQRGAGTGAGAEPKAQAAPG
ncbi:MAG: response regulator [Desulfovibrionaceae bacterium]|jgi:two-component system OmpR family response regulator|nr:response regulator [Desulfovibrionaceae bacterium]